MRTQCFPFSPLSLFNLFQQYLIALIGVNINIHLNPVAAKLDKRDVPKLVLTDGLGVLGRCEENIPALPCSPAARD